MEIRYVNKHIEKLSRLKAEESIQRINEISMGSGMMKKEGQRKILNDLNKKIQGPKKVRRKLTHEQQAFMLAQMGIKLECQKT